MTLESPATYSEWYWKHSLDALRARSEECERSLTPIVSQIIADLNLQENLPESLKPYYAMLSSPPAPDWDDMQRSFLGVIGRYVELAAGEESARPFKYKHAAKMLTLQIDAETAISLYQRKRIGKELYEGRMHSAGFADSEAIHQYNSRRPYPSIPDIITYSRYHGDAENPKDFAWKLFDIAEVDWDLWDWLSWQKLTTEQVQALYKRRFWTENEYNIELSRLGWHGTDKMAVMDLAWTLPNAMLLVQGDLLQEANTDSIIADISKADIHPTYAKQYLDGILTKPATSDLIAYELRRDPSLSNLDRELRKIGVHPNYFELLKELAYQIPPVADIITMAVREAFTPDIAARFGQYEGLPTQFVEWVGKKGLSKEWAERYWAAHWTLPSPQQGFEMLHRGIIGKDDLLLLLRALDIMPFWRDKLIEMAYEPLNRIDVRRMYKLGVLTESDVTNAYKELGYNDTNANRLTDFVVRDTRQSLARFTSANVVTAFTKRFIDEGQASSLLRDMGIKDTEIPHIIQTAIYKREWSYKQERIDAIENLYKKGKYTENQTRNELTGLNLPADHIQTLLQQWQLKAEAEKIATWTTAQTISFLKKGLITPARATQEFIELGYNTEHIKTYLASVTQ